jgi:hypothetical protein
MRTALRTAAAIVLAIGCLAGVGATKAQAQYGVPYRPYSMTRGNFIRYAPAYYPRINTYYNRGYYSMRPRYYYGGGRRWAFNRGGFRRWGGRRW